MGQAVQASTLSPAVVTLSVCLPARQLSGHRLQGSGKRVSKAKLGQENEFIYDEAVSGLCRDLSIPHAGSVGQVYPDPLLHSTAMQL